ncbi:MAG: hypothetical protein OEY70_08180 [Acidimicrobiia bacterium]|nr:hypothetical protein [Acidimicrobiia bacterium]
MDHRRRPNPRRALAATAVAMASLAGPLTLAPGALADRRLPDTIDAPAGFALEGVAAGEGLTFYVGSLADGRIARGDVRQGTMEVFVSAPVMAPAVGLKADRRHNLLWVAGGPSGQAAAYDLDTGAAVATLTLTTSPAFINDVTVTRDAAWFTDSQSAVLHKVPVGAKGDVGQPEAVPLSGPAAAVVPGQFNLNGITAAADGKTLIAVNSFKGELYAIDAATGASTLIVLGGASVAGGDGILLVGRTLYVLQNGGAPGTTNQIVVIDLNLQRSKGEVERTITSPLFETATTVALVGDVLVAANAQFRGAPVDPGPEVVLIPRGDRRDR